MKREKLKHLVKTGIAFELSLTKYPGWTGCIKVFVNKEYCFDIFKDLKGIRHIKERVCDNEKPLFKSGELSMLLLYK